MINLSGKKIDPTNADTQDDEYEMAKTEHEWNRTNFDAKSVVSIEEFEIDSRHSVAVTPGFLK